MIHLAIETSTAEIDMALMDGGGLLASVAVPRPGGASEVLIHGLDALVALTGIRTQEIAMISSSEGPGTYTALRVGHLFAEGLSLSLGVPHRKVSPFRILLDQADLALEEGPAFLVAVLDARRGEVNACLFAKLPGAGPYAHVQCAPDSPFSGRATDPEKLLAALPPGPGMVTGPGVPALSLPGSRPDTFLPRVRFVVDTPRARTMGARAFRTACADSPEPGPEHPLVYGRDSVVLGPS